jgi:tRNA A-37 threonylcarbamoyl transferase component Bud32
MDTHFDIIRQNNKKLYINKSFRNTSFESACGGLIGKEYLQKHFELTAVPSSHFCRVYKLVVRFNNVDTCLYLKEHLSRGILDTIKHIIRPGRAKRAFDASLMLQNNGFDAPIVIALLERRSTFGGFRTGGALITKEVENAEPILKSLTDSCPNRDNALDRRRSLIAGFGQTIGQMHADGIFHGDLRAGNIMARDEKNNWRFFFLDNERTRKFRKLPARLRVKNLVQLQISSTTIIGDTDRMRFYKRYLVKNTMSRMEGKILAEKVFKKTIRRLRGRTEIGNRSNKYLQTNEEFLRIENDRYLAVFDRSLCEGADPFDLIEKTDALMDNGKVIKSDTTTYLSLLLWNNKRVVIKRYNHKGLIHSLRYTIKGSRAKRSWLNGQLLTLLNILTPKPLAFIEQRKGLLLWKSYLVTEYVPAQKLCDFLQDDRISGQEKKETAERLRRLLDKLGEYRITHGDLKPTNILITKNGTVLTDLDSVKIHKSNVIYQYRRTKDMERFTKLISSE